MKLEQMQGKDIIALRTAIEDGEQWLTRGSKFILEWADDEIQLFSFADETGRDCLLAYDEFDQYFAVYTQQVDFWQQNWIKDERQQTEGENNMDDMLGQDYICTKDVPVNQFETLYHVGDRVIVVGVDEINVTTEFDKETGFEILFNHREFNEHFLPKEKVTCCSNNK